MLQKMVCCNPSNFAEVYVLLSKYIDYIFFKVYGLGQKLLSGRHSCQVCIKRKKNHKAETNFLNADMKIEMISLHDQNIITLDLARVTSVHPHSVSFHVVHPP